MRGNKSYKYKNVRVRPIDENDIEKLRVWRNDKNNSKYLSDISYITSEMQLNWFKQYSKDEDSLIYAIDEIEMVNEIVGTVALYNFREKIAECGRFLVGDCRVSGKGIGRIGIILCLYAGFTELGLDKVDASVHEDNVAALTTDKKAGFIITEKQESPDGYYEYKMYVDKKYFFNKHNFLSEVIIESI